MKVRNQKLHVLGKVSSSIAEKIKEMFHIVMKPGDLFLFVGYNFYEYETGNFFDIAIDGSNQKWKFDYKIKLKKVFDEFGRNYDCIPEGYKTICLFECKPTLPQIIKKLPTLKTWDFNSSGVFLCNHEDIDLLHAPETDTLIFKALEKIILSTMLKNNRVVRMSDLELLLPTNSSRFIIDNMLISGSIRKNNDQFELAI